MPTDRRYRPGTPPSALKEKHAHPTRPEQPATRVRCLLLTCVALATMLVGALPAAAAERPTQAPAPSGSEATTPQGIHGLIWKTRDGKVHSVTKSNRADLPDVPTTAAAYCALGAYDFRYTDQFRWTSYHSCSGSYGLVTHRSHMQRSSWSGWRAYSDWRNQGPTAYSMYYYYYYYWQMYCKGGGTYDYRPELQIYASGIGYWSPSVTSNNTIRRACGT